MMTHHIIWITALYTAHKSEAVHRKPIFMGTYYTGCNAYSTSSKQCRVSHLLLWLVTPETAFWQSSGCYCDMWPGTCFGNHACCTSLYRCEAVSQQPWPFSPVGHAYIQPLPKCAAQAVYMPNRLIECLYHTHIVSHSPAADSISHTSLSSLLVNVQIVNIYTC